VGTGEQDEEDGGRCAGQPRPLYRPPQRLLARYCTRPRTPAPRSRFTGSPEPGSKARFRVWPSTDDKVGCLDGNFRRTSSSVIELILWRPRLRCNRRLPFHPYAHQSSVHSHVANLSVIAGRRGKGPRAADGEMPEAVIRNLAASEGLSSLASARRCYRAVELALDLQYRKLTGTRHVTLRPPASGLLSKNTSGSGWSSVRPTPSFARPGSGGVAIREAPPPSETC
jgi:hypothetical protein